MSISLFSGSLGVAILVSLERMGWERCMMFKRCEAFCMHIKAQRSERRRVLFVVMG